MASFARWGFVRGENCRWIDVCSHKLPRFAQAQLGEARPHPEFCTGYEIPGQRQQLSVGNPPPQSSQAAPWIVCGSAR